MLSENIQVASLITDSLQQKVYNMALEELEAFLGRSVEPLPSLADPRSPQHSPSTRGAMSQLLGATRSRGLLHPAPLWWC